MSLSLSFVRGEAYEAIGTHKDAAGNAVNITGWTIVLTGRKKPGSEDPPAVQIQADVTNGLAGEYAFAMTSAQTLAVPSTVDYSTGKDTPLFADIWRINAGFETPMESGTLTVEKGAFFQ